MLANEEIDDFKLISMKTIFNAHFDGKKETKK